MAACSELRPPAPPPRQTDVQVEATVHLQIFPDPAAVVRVLRSRGFEVTELDGGPVRVRGHFLQLRDVKDELEQLLEAPAPPRPGGTLRHSCHSGSGRGHGGPPLLVDSDVFLYARRVRGAELDGLMTRHGSAPTWKKEGEETTAVTVATPEARRRLQVFLQDLSRSLRVQDLRLGDLDQNQNQDLLGIIRRNRDVSGSVLVRFPGDQIRLVGPSEESWELKQRLLGNPARGAGLSGGPAWGAGLSGGPARGAGLSGGPARGAGLSGGPARGASRGRSRSLPPPSRDSGRGGGATVGGATGDGQQGGSTGPDGGGAHQVRDQTRSGKVLQRQKKKKRWLEFVLKIFKK